MFTQKTSNRIARTNLPATPFIQPDVDAEAPVNARDITPVIGDRPQVHKMRTLEARRRRATRRANRH